MNENSQIKEKIMRIAANKNEDLYLAIAELSPIQIEVVQMRFWENLSIEQIANVLCLTWDEVDQLITETLAHLRCQLELALNKMPTPQAA